MVSVEEADRDEISPSTEQSDEPTYSETTPKPLRVKSTTQGLGSSMES